MKLVISDAHEGTKATATRGVLSAIHPRCRVYFARNALAHAGQNGRCVVSALMAIALVQNDPAPAKAQWRKVANQRQPNLLKLAAPMDLADEDVLAYMGFPAAPRAEYPLGQSDRAIPTNGRPAQLGGAQEPRQGDGITAAGLDPIARLQRDQ